MRWFVEFGSTVAARFGHGAARFVVLACLLVWPVGAFAQNAPEPITPAGEPTNPEAVAEQAEALDLTDFHFVLDRSGSLRDTDPNGGRYEAIRMLSRIVTDQDGLTLRMFDEGVQSLSVPSSKGEERWNEILTTLRNEGSQGRYTDIEAGLRSATGIVNPKRRSAVVLLTDGLIDLPDPNQVLPSRNRLLNEMSETLRRSGTFLFVVGFGPNGDNDFLRDMAKRSGGVMVQVDNEKNIAHRFLELFERVKKPQSVEVKGDSFYIDGMVREVTLILETPGPEEQLSIKSPTGATLTPNDSDGDKLTWVQSNLYHIVSIKDPVVGTWKVVTNTRSRVRIHLLTDLKLLVRLSDGKPTAGQPVAVTAFLTAKDQQVDNLILRRSTQYTCKLTDEAGKELSQMLLTADTARGVWNGIFTAPEQPSSYKLNCLAKNPVFNRMQTVYVDVGRGPFATAAIARINDKQYQVMVQLNWGFNSPTDFLGGKVFWSHDGSAASGLLGATGMNLLRAVVDSEKSMPPFGYVEGTWMLPDQTRLPMELRVPFMQNGLPTPMPGMTQAVVQPTPVPTGGGGQSGKEWMLFLALGIMLTSSVGFAVMKLLPSKQASTASDSEFDADMDEADEVRESKPKRAKEAPAPIGDLSSFEPPSLAQSAQTGSLDDSVRNLTQDSAPATGEPGEDKWYGQLEDSLQKLERQRGGTPAPSPMNQAQAPVQAPTEAAAPAGKKYDDLAASLARLEAEAQESKPAKPDPKPANDMGSLADTLARLEAEVEQKQPQAKATPAAPSDGPESLEAMLARLEAQTNGDQALPDDTAEGVDDAYAGLEEALARMEAEESPSAPKAKEPKPAETPKEDESLADMIARLETESGEHEAKMMESDDTLMELEAALARMELENGIEPPPPKPAAKPAPEPAKVAPNAASKPKEAAPSPGDGEESLEAMLARLEAEAELSVTPPQPAESVPEAAKEDFKDTLAALEAQLAQQDAPNGKAAEPRKDKPLEKDGEERHAYTNLQQSLARLTAEADSDGGNGMYAGLEASLAELDQELGSDSQGDGEFSGIEQKLAALEKDALSTKPVTAPTPPPIAKPPKPGAPAATSKPAAKGKLSQDSLDDLMAEFDRATKAETAASAPSTGGSISSP